MKHPPAVSPRALLAGGLRELVSRPASQLPALDALRSAAILGVMVNHWAAHFYPRLGGAATPLQDSALFYYGWAGVDLFFVLSGFLIGKQLWRELEQTGTVRMGRFLLRRGLRIWPLYFAILLYYVFVNPDIDPRLADWTFLSNYWPGGVVRTWSLSTEEQFYIAVPLVILLVRKRLGMAGYFAVVAALELAVLGYRRGELDAFLATGLAWERADYLLVYPFHTHVDGLLIGLVIALIAVVKPTVFSTHRLTRPGLQGFSLTGAAVFGACAVVALALRASNDRLFSFAVLGLLFGGATFWVLCDRSVLTKPLSAWVFYPISRLSYGMYLNHGWVWPATNKWSLAAGQAITDNREGAFLIGLAIYTLVSIGCAVVSFLLIEHPFLVMRERWMSHRNQASTHTSVDGQPAAA